MRLSSLPAVILLFSLPQLPGCDTKKISEKIKATIYDQTDSVLTKSQGNIVVLGRVSEKSDSVITEKVTKTVDKIQDLTYEVRVLKKENNELKKNRADTTVSINKHFDLLPIDNGSNSDLPNVTNGAD
jgi:malate synthase